MSRRRIRIVTVVLTVTAVIAAPAAAQQQDLRSPDARDVTAQPQQDLRSPDARDVIGQPAGTSVDLRSPDAADPYSGVPVKVVVPARVVRRVDQGFDWRDAGIGAAGGFALVLLVITGSAVVRRQKPALG